MGQLPALRQYLRQLGPVVVAFSGGADSAFLAWVANSELGRARVIAATAVSPSLSRSELEDCRALAREWDLDHREVAAGEHLRPAYVSNGADRCWHCKDELMRCLAPLASAGPARTIVLGVNLDDLGDYRPGQRAAQEAGGVFPLVEAGFTKADVRRESRHLGLRTWDKPAAACLASRVPYGTPVTVGTLGRVARAEAGVAALGFRSLRVRHYGHLARVELPVEDLPRALELRAELVSAVRDAGYDYVTIDLEGLRSGNLNSSLGITGPVGTIAEEVPR